MSQQIADVPDELLQTLVRHYTRSKRCDECDDKHLYHFRPGGPCEYDCRSPNCNGTVRFGDASITLRPEHVPDDIVEVVVNRWVERFQCSDCSTVNYYYTRPGGVETRECRGVACDAVFPL